MQTLLLIDLDGTLLKSPHYEAWCSAARRAGLVEPTLKEYFLGIAGLPRFEGAKYLLEINRKKENVTPTSVIDSKTLAWMKHKEFIRICYQVILFDDAQRLLKRIKETKQSVRFYTASENAPGLFKTALRKEKITFLKPEITIQKAEQSRKDLFLSLINLNRSENEGFQKERHLPFASSPPLCRTVKKYAMQNVLLIDDAPISIDVACGIGFSACHVRRDISSPAPKDPHAFIIPSLDTIPLPIPPL